MTEQEIPIGGVKVVGHFEPGGYYHESPLSKWFLEGYSAPGEVIKSGSVKFEPPGGILKGAWLLHLEDEWGTRLSPDVPIETDPDNKEWFFVKFREFNSILVPTAAPVRVTATAPPSTGQRSGSAGTPTPTPMATPPPATSGWSFTDVQFRPFQRRGVMISGNIANNTNSSQKIVGLTGTVTDSLGRVINVQGSQASWTNAVVPAGGQTPFSLLVFGIQSVEDFDLGVVSQPDG